MSPYRDDLTAAIARAEAAEKALADERRAKEPKPTIVVAETTAGSDMAAISDAANDRVRRPLVERRVRKIERKARRLCSKAARNGYYAAWVEVPTWWNKTDRAEVVNTVARLLADDGFRVDLRGEDRWPSLAPFHLDVSWGTGTSKK